MREKRSPSSRVVNSPLASKQPRSLSPVCRPDQAARRTALRGCLSFVFSTLKAARPSNKSETVHLHCGSFHSKSDIADAKCDRTSSPLRQNIEMFMIRPRGLTYLSNEIYEIADFIRLSSCSPAEILKMDTNLQASEFGISEDITRHSFKDQQSSPFLNP